MADVFQRARARAGPIDPNDPNARAIASFGVADITTQNQQDQFEFRQAESLRQEILSSTTLSDSEKKRIASYVDPLSNRQGRISASGITAAQNLLRQGIGKERDVRLGRIKEKEELLKQELGAVRQGTEAAIESQLDKLLEETGIGANVARQQVGSAFADRGLSRSTFAQKGIEQVSTAEVEQKAGARIGAAQDIASVRNAEQGALKSLKESRERLEQEKFEGEAGAFEQKINMMEKESVENMYRQMEMSQMKSARDRQMFGNIVGGIGQAATMAFFL